MTILSSRKANVNANTGGGDKKQGLAPKATSYFRPSFNGSQYSTQTGSGEDRFKLVCMNQLGGIGKGKSQFASNADGAKCPQEYDISALLQDIQHIQTYIHNKLADIIQKSGLSSYNSVANFELCFVGNRETFLTDIDGAATHPTLKTTLDPLANDISGHIFTHLYSDDNPYTIYLRTDKGTDTSDYKTQPYLCSFSSSIMSKIRRINDIIKNPPPNIPVSDRMKEGSKLGLHTLGLLNNNFTFNYEGNTFTARRILRMDGYGILWPMMSGGIFSYNERFTYYYPGAHLRTEFRMNFNAGLEKAEWETWWLDNSGTAKNGIITAFNDWGWIINKFGNDYIFDNYMATGEVDFDRLNKFKDRSPSRGSDYLYALPPQGPYEAAQKLDDFAVDNPIEFIVYPNDIWKLNIYMPIYLYNTYIDIDKYTPSAIKTWIAGEHSANMLQQVSTTDGRLVTALEYLLIYHLNIPKAAEGTREIGSIAWETKECITPVGMNNEVCYDDKVIPRNL